VGAGGLRQPRQPASRLTSRNHGLTAVVITALVFVLWSSRTWVAALVIAIVLLIVLGLIELIGRPPAEPPAVGQHSVG
jgi:O-antigen ligase